MSKSVVINLGSGDYQSGFPRVTAQIWAEGHLLPEQFIGSLPPAPFLIELYKDWHSLYQHLYDDQQLLSPAPKNNSQEIEIESGDITNVSVVSFDELSEELQAEINEWLTSREFLHIDQQLRSRLTTAEEIRVIIETCDLVLRRLPWHCWNFFRDFPKAEMALSRPEYKRTLVNPAKGQSRKVRILGVLGNSFGIDFERESQFLNSLADTQTVFLVKPSRQELNAQLWNSDGWDILFFAGHSQTENEIGRIYINQNPTNNSLTIEELNQALLAAIGNGLKLAIFNSCDGLGLAVALEKLNIPTVIVMREPVPNRVAQDFFQYFLEAFAVRRLSLYLAVQQARRKLQGVESEFPGASWLPVICQNPSIEAPTWLTLGGMPPSPYRGLFAFGEEDAHLYFGREKFTQDLLLAVKTKPLVAVVGASGSGKSSVVFAGLIPALRASDEFTNVTDNLFVNPTDNSSVKSPTKSAAPHIICFRPGHNPIAALAVALAPLLHFESHEQVNNPKSIDAQAASCREIQNLKSNARRQIELEVANTLRQDHQALTKIIKNSVQQSNCTRLILIADQFEELYTISPESQRQSFLDGLLNACRNAPAFTLILTLRADFYGHAVSDRCFSDALQGAVYNLGPMSREELRSVIEKPAAQMQVRLEEGLTNLLINDALGYPGRLPLLEFALTQMWSRQLCGWLTHAAYNEIGGVEQALANHAEAVYAQLTHNQRLLVQRVFIQLVQPGTGVDFNRRLATSDEVGSENWDLVTQLASARVLVTNRNELSGEETVEIAHEALVCSWGRLENWLLLASEFRLWQEQLRVAIHQWESSGFDNGALLRGKPLADAQHWQHKRVEELSFREKNFIERSLVLQQWEKQTQKRRRRFIIYGLVSGLIVTSTLAVVAWWQWHNSVISQIQAINESSEALFASNQKLDALKEAIRAKRELQKLGGTDAGTQLMVESALRRAVYGAVEYNRLEGHRGEVKSAVFSPDGNTLASTSNDKSVKLWKRDGTLLITLEGHKAGVLDVAFSPDGQTLASASEDKTIKLWKRDGTLLGTLEGHDAAVSKVAFSPDGKTLASASEDHSVKLWRVSGKVPVLLTTLKKHQDEVKAVVFSRDGNMIASASKDKTVKLWKRDGTFLTTVARHNDTVWDVAFSPDGNTIASASADNTVKLWNKDGKFLKTLEGHQAPVSGVAFSPDGKTLASASWDNTVKLWNKDGSLLTTLNGHSDRVWGVTFSPDSKILASVSGDMTIKFWKLDSALLTTLQGHSAPVIGVAISPNGKMVASASDDKTVKLWTQDSTLPVTLDHKAAVFAVVFSPDGSTLASASLDSTLKLWNKNGTLLKTLKGHKAGIWGVAFSPDGNTIASAGWDKTVKLWNKNGTELTTLKGHQESIWDVAISPDGNTIASASSDMTVKLWKRDGTELTTVKGHKAAVWGVAFSPDGNIIATGSEDKTVKLWKRDGTLLTTLEGHQSIVFGVAFSPDGKILASASADKTVKLWNVEAGKLPVLLATLNGHSGRVWGVAFSPDGKTLASASEDKTVILWKLDRVVNLNKILAYGCDWVRDYLKTNPHVKESDRHICDMSQ
ncbi:CHAT domain-containing protein [Scytonema tolypothrichoides VB-61278]|nr:CHAT domain-containing protein [Scytonema tolypothrichoides VB-61278]